MIYFITQTLKCLVSFCLGLILTFVKTLLFVFCKSVNALEFSVRNSLVSFIQVLLSSDAFYFMSGKVSCIFPTLLFDVKIVEISDEGCPLKILFISYKVLGECFALFLRRFKGTLTQIWKSTYIFKFIQK